MARIYIELVNNFHNTRVTVMATSRVFDSDNDGYLTCCYIPKQQVKKAKKALCGISCCQCSGDLGIRGVQTNGVYIFHSEMQQDGSCVLNMEKIKNNLLNKE